METVRLGRTGLQATRMGLGGGGPSKLGSGLSDGDPEAVVRKALELGVNFIDTSEVYGTEEAVGRGIADVPRDKIVLSTKFMYRREDTLRRPEELEPALDNSLKRLGTDYVDIYHIHAVAPDHYQYVESELFPELKRLQEKGKVRFTGITEMFSHDTEHTMLQQAVRSGVWDVIMVGFNLLNQSGRERVLKPARTHDMGTLCMFAVRKALRSWEAVVPFLQQLVESAELDAGKINFNDIRGTFTQGLIETTLPDLAYRFVQAEKDFDVILSGTGNLAHIEENYRSFNTGPLPEALVTHLRSLFQDAQSASGQ